MNKAFYRNLLEHKDQEDLTMLTVVDGPDKGEKLLLAGNDILASDGIPKDRAAFLEKNRDILLPFTKPESQEVGQNKVYGEKIGSQPKLVICGGGYVSSAILQIGKMLGFYITVIDDRLSFANEAKRLGADESICDEFVHALSEIKGGANTYFVIVTRGHKWDADCLREVLNKEYAYAGMMGSRRRVILLKKQLEQEGYDEEKLSGLHAPIGMAIGAESPQEIAVSVWAEIIQERSEHKKITGYDTKTLHILAGDADGEMQLALATIIERRGSAPREIGTKMIIYPDERVVGTIGGGCMESEVIREARYMLREESEICKVVQIDMSGLDAEEEGMACGGNILVYLEKLNGVSL